MNTLSFLVGVALGAVGYWAARRWVLSRRMHYVTYLLRTTNHRTHSQRVKTYLPLRASQRARLRRFRRDFARGAF